ncbi:MAG: ABC transporter ATP-binding protein, partial [Candidatus Thalassarchaeaceae archaeon]|nr:ABC transporter ATP-binding protein [Candidatus Thalassarchaeaceae archaeon]
ETPTINRIGEAIISPFSLIYRTLVAKPQSSAAFLSIMAFVTLAHRWEFADEAQSWTWALLLAVPLLYSVSSIWKVKSLFTDEMTLEERVAMEADFSGSGFSMDSIDPRTGAVFSEYRHLDAEITGYEMWLRSQNPYVWLSLHRFGVSLQGLPAALAVTIVVFLMLWMPFSSLMGMVVISSLLTLPVIVWLDFLRLDPAHSRQVQEILEDVRIPNPEAVVKMYPHELSGGMRQRVMIGMMMSCEPKLLIADEPTTALDVTIQAQILKLMMDLRDDKGTSILLITHDLGVIAEMCDDVSVMYAGRVVERAPVKELFANPLHAYTRGLMACTPNIASIRKSILPAIPGQVANPSDFVRGCRFCQRMERYGDTLITRPQMIESSPGHWVEACPICLDESEDKWE